MSTVPGGWYPDPADGGRVRYWDGAAWTEHTAPSAQPAHAAQAPTITAATAAPARKGLGAGAIVAIVIGSIVVIIALFAALAIPVFVGQQDKARDAAAKAALASIGTGVSAAALDGQSNPYVWAEGDIVHIEGAPAGRDTVELPDGVTFEGYGRNGYLVCVWVSTSDGTALQWKGSSGISEGNCRGYS
jgi:type II secretory pathway pseudopilin PulG